MAEHDQAYLGIDVGGTKILAVLVSGAGRILARHKQATSPGAVPLTDQIVAAAEGALAKAGRSPETVFGLGIGVPAVVDSRAGLVIHAPNLAVDDPRLVERLRERLPWPIALGNDVNLGTLAELWFGAARQASDLVGIFVGTGIGGGVILGRRLRTGPEDQAGEIGHMVLQVDGPLCGCGNRGCFEALASRIAIERNIREGLKAGRKSSVGPPSAHGRIASGALATALAAGDELVTEVMRREAHYLAQGLLSIRHLIDPELIVLGGGVMEACGDFLLPLIQEEVAQDPLRCSRSVLRVVLSQLADDAVALGAAALIRAELRDQTLTDFVSGPAGAADPKAPGPHIDNVQFGLAVVNGAEFASDLYFRADGKVVKRSKKHARQTYGTSHVLDATELAKVCKGDPDLLIIGNGFDGVLRLSEDGEKYLQERGVAYQVLPTPEAVGAFAEASGRKALFLHVTC